MGLFASKLKEYLFSGPNSHIGTNPNAKYKRLPTFNRFSNRFDVPDNYGVPTKPLLAAGNSVQRQLHSTAPQIVGPQTIIPVGITGDGSNLSGMLTAIPLIDLNNAAPGN